MAVLFAVFVTVHGVVFIRQAEPLDRVAIQALRSFFVGQIQSSFLHPFETLHVGGPAVSRQAVESLLPLRQVHAKVTERYLVPVDAEQSQETVFLVEPRILEICFLRARPSSIRDRVIEVILTANYCLCYEPKRKHKPYFLCAPRRAESTLYG